MTTFDCNEGSHTFFCQWPQTRLRLHFYFCTLYNKKEPYFLYCLSSLNISVTDLEGMFFDGDTSLSSAVSIRFSEQLLTNMRWSSLVQTDIQKFFFLFLFLQMMNRCLRFEGPHWESFRRNLKSSRFWTCRV